MINKIQHMGKDIPVLAYDFLEYDSSLLLEVATPFEAEYIIRDIGHLLYFKKSDDMSIETILNLPSFINEQSREKKFFLKFLTDEFPELLEVGIKELAHILNRSVSIIYKDILNDARIYVNSLKSEDRAIFNSLYQKYEVIDYALNKRL